MASTEIFDLRNLNAAGYGLIGVYVNQGYEPYPAGYNPLPDTNFDSYQPDQGFIKNTGLRTPLFTGPFISSPLLDDGDYTYLTDSKDYTWLYNTVNTMAIEPFDAAAYPSGMTRYSAALYAPAPPGSLQVVINDKNQPQTFNAKDDQGAAIAYCFATDSNGNEFILGSVDSAYASDPTAPFKQATLPDGWVKTIKPLSADLKIEPSYGDGNRRIYNQFRDNLTNNYFQIAFASNGIGIARGIPGMALSGGNLDDQIIGTSIDETLYGARGNDRLIGGGGNDQLWGDDGNDTLIPADGATTLWGGSGKDTFVINQGQATIQDFSPGDNDVIDLTGFHLSGRALIHNSRNTETGMRIALPDAASEATVLVTSTLTQQLLLGVNLLL